MYHVLKKYGDPMDLFIFLIVIVTFGLMASDPRRDHLKVENIRSDRITAIQTSIHKDSKKEDSNESS